MLLSLCSSIFGGLHELPSVVIAAFTKQKPGNLLPPPVALSCAVCVVRGRSSVSGLGGVGPAHWTAFTKAFSGVVSFHPLCEACRSPLPHLTLTSRQSAGFRKRPSRLCLLVCLQNGNVSFYVLKGQRG